MGQRSYKPTYEVPCLSKQYRLNLDASVREDLGARDGSTDSICNQFHKNGCRPSALRTKIRRGEARCIPKLRRSRTNLNSVPKAFAKVDPPIKPQHIRGRGHQKKPTTEYLFLSNHFLQIGVLLAN